LKRNCKNGWRATFQHVENAFDEKHPIRGTFCSHEEGDFATTRRKKLHPREGAKWGGFKASRE